MPGSAGFGAQVAMGGLASVMARVSAKTKSTVALGYFTLLEAPAPYLGGRRRRLGILRPALLCLACEETRAQRGPSLCSHLRVRRADISEVV